MIIPPLNLSLENIRPEHLDSYMVYLYIEHFRFSNLRTKPITFNDFRVHTHLTMRP